MAAWDFGRVSRLVRQRGSLRQEDLSHLTGLSQAYLSMLESGARTLTHIDKIVQFLSGLGVPAELVPLPLPRQSAQLADRELRNQADQSLESALPRKARAWESPLDIAKRLNATTSSNIDPATVAVLEQSVADLVNRYEAEGPHQLAPEALDLRIFVQDRLDGRQPPRQRAALFRVAAQASGLLGYMAVNAGRESVAEAYCKEAEGLAKEITDLELLMWIQGTRSLNAYYAGHYDHAVQWAEAGLAIAPDNPQAIRLQSNGRARALGKLGDRSGAIRAIASAEELSSHHSVPAGLTSCISFEPYATARTLANAATVHVALADAPRVLAYAEQIDELVEHSDSAWSQALVRLDVAAALLTGPRPDVEQAMALGRQVLEAGGGPPIRSVVQRAGDLLAGAKSWQSVPAVREYEDTLRSWQSAPHAKELARSDRMARPTA
ncbi:helix-turn-helix transcriptional regulator [Streptomyces sp. 2314.4]|uniref:helix-turn-helix domain-containing protein n=1 Tax=Streptomyces sp. 2314.4 TaxID=1881025 RepID=UPI00159F90A7|nr:helix-turn-helix transcriptional regulator [Streptomyces sp. 2314.4]